MTSLPDAIGQLARALSLLFRLPTAAVLVLAGAVSSLAVLFAVINIVIADATSPGQWVVLAVAILLGLPVLIFAVLRWRWFHRLQAAAPTPVSTEVVSPSDLADQVSSQMGDVPGGEDAQVLMDALAEGRMPAGMGNSRGSRLTRWLGSGRLGILGYALTRIEQVQRALLVAAGGPVAAPYLKDDLRLSTMAFLGSLVAVPLAGLLAIILALVLLTAY